METCSHGICRVCLWRCIRARRPTQALRAFPYPLLRESAHVGAPSIKPKHPYLFLANPQCDETGKPDSTPPQR